jgi:anti-sigma factor RsiW
VSGPEISCLEVWPEIADFIDGILDPTLRWRIELHLDGCERCAAVLDGVRTVLALAADAQMFDLPTGFGVRLKRVLARKLDAD